MARSTSTKRCPICGETVTLEKGQLVALREHYKTKHGEIYRWRQGVKLAAGVAGVASLIFIVLTASFGQTFSLLSIAGMLVVLFSIAFYGDRREKRLRSSWQEQHETQASN